MTAFLLTEDQESKLQLSKQALVCMATLTDQCGAAQPNPSEYAAMLTLIADALPTELEFRATL